MAGSSARARPNRTRSHPAASSPATGLVHVVLGQTDLLRQRLGAPADFVGRRLDVERERHRQVLNHATARRAAPRARSTMPKRSTVASQSALSLMSRVRRPNSADVAAVGQRRAGHQVDEDFRRRLIESEQRHRFTRGDAQLRNPQRTQPAVVLGDPGRVRGPDRSRLNLLIDLVDDAAGLGERGDLDLGSGEVADDRAVGNPWRGRSAAGRRCPRSRR